MSDNQTIQSNKPDEQELLNNVVNALERVDIQTKQMIFSMSCGMSDLEIIRCFNQQALDAFNILMGITTRMKKEGECKVGGYKALFDNAIKINAKLPLDKFTLLILEYAPEIYSQNDDVFLNMAIPETNIKVGNEFSIFRSEMFKKLWKQMNQSDKNEMKNKIVLLTTYAHTYLYKTILSIKS